jgi:hypothetical protein
MRFAIVPLAALVLLAACGSGAPTIEEEALPETGAHPEVTAGSAAPAAANASVVAGGRGGDTPGGPVADRASGTGGDTGTN